MYWQNSPLIFGWKHRVEWILAYKDMLWMLLLFTSECLSHLLCVECIFNSNKEMIKYVDLCCSYRLSQLCIDSKFKDTSKTIQNECKNKYNSWPIVYCIQNLNCEHDYIFESRQGVSISYGRIFQTDYKTDNTWPIFYWIHNIL